MWRIRVFEERVGELTRADEVHGLVHLSIGQEAVAVGVCGQLRADDAVYCGHRAHGHAIAKGAPLGRVMAELMGREGGLCRGLGGSMHLVDVEHGFLGATGVVGGNVPLALGSALAARLGGRRPGGGRLLRRRRRPGRHLRRVRQPRHALAAAGDPRLREQRLRRVHAALGAHERRARRPTSLRRTASSGETVDGNDIAAVRDAFAGFLAKARGGEGPLLLECLTHRLRGHYEGDPQHYRQALAADGVAGARPDPAPAAARSRRGLARRGRAGRLEEEARAEVETAVDLRAREPVPADALDRPSSSYAS